MHQQSQHENSRRFDKPYQELILQQSLNPQELEDLILQSLQLHHIHRIH